MQAVIMAGGKGTRLAELTQNVIPKPMVPILGKPLLEWQLECLKDNGILDVIFIIGHLGNKIQEYFSDGSSRGMKILYIEEATPLGTAGSLYYLNNYLTDDNFLLIWGDVLFDIDIARMHDFHKSKQAMATLFVHPNSHPFDSDLVIMDEDNHITGFDSKSNTRTYYYDNCVNAGLYILDRSICNFVKQPEKLDLEEDLLLPLIEEKASIYGYYSSEYIKDVGTIERISGAIHDIQNGFISSRCLKNQQKCIFLDWNGISKIFHDQLYQEKYFKLDEQTAKVFRRLNQSSYLGIMVAKRSEIVKKIYSIEEIAQFYRKMSTLLGRSGVFLDDFLCSSNKSQLEILYKAKEKFHIDLSSSWIVSTPTLNIQEWRNVGLQIALIQDNGTAYEQKYNTASDLICESLEQAIIKILEG